MKKKFLSILLALALCLTLLPTAALADGDGDAGTAPEPQAANESPNSVPYVDPSETNQNQSCDTYTLVTSETGTTWGESDKTTWYVVNENVTIDSTVTVSGNVHLILCDGATLTVTGGLYGGDYAALHIYGQSGGTGTMTVTGNASYNAAIYMSSSKTGSILEINSGKVTVTGSNNDSGASYGIYTTEALTVNGGTLTVTGGAANNSYGIYQGYNSGNLTVNGGTLKATGGMANTNSYGIYKTNNSCILIKGGLLTATGGEAKYSYGIDTYAQFFVQDSGEVNATGGTSTETPGGSWGIHTTQLMTVKGIGKVTATGGAATATTEGNKAANITSCGIYAENGLTVEGSGSVNATGGAASATATLSTAKSYSYGIHAKGNLTVKGGSVTATGGAASATGATTNKAAVVIADSKSYGIYAEKDLTVEGGTLEATGGEAKANATSAATDAVIADSKSCGIYAEKELTESGGTLKATGGTASANATGGPAAESCYDIYYGALGFAYTALKAPLTYTGSDQIGKISGIVTVVDSNKAAVAVYDSANPTDNPLTEAKNAGNYTVTVTSGETVVKTYTVPVGKATVSDSNKTNFFTFTQPNPELTYNGENQISTIKAAVGLKEGVAGLNYSVVVYQGRYFSGLDPVSESGATSIGDYHVYVTVTESTNFNATTGTPGIHLGTVPVKGQTLTASDFTFTAPSLTYTGVDQIEAIENAVSSNVTGADAIEKIVYTKSGETETEVTTAKDAGTYFIKVTAGAGTAYAELTDPIEFGPVTIAKAQATASYAKAAVKVAKDGTVTNALTTNLTDLSATYSSSDESVATVATDGKVTLVAAGTTTITATIAETDNYTGATASYTLTVLPAGATVYTITVSAGENGSVSTSGGEYGSTETVTVTATPNEGYRFVNWTAAGTVVSTDATYSFFPTENLTLTAHFELIPAPAPVITPGSSNPTVSTETTTTPDGSTIKTETRQDGTVIETVSSPDGSTTKTETKTETGKDGTTVETKKTTVSDGSSSITTTVTAGTGSTTTSNVSVSSKAAKDAQKSGEAVTLPVEVSAGKSGESSTTIRVDLPANSGALTVEIPVSNVTPDTVAILVNEDGSKTLIPLSKVTGSGIRLTLEKSATIKLVDNSKRFLDVKDSDFFSAAVQWAASRGITDGIGGGKFGPNLGCTRAQIVTFLWRAAGCPVVNSAMNFSDVDEDSFYAEAVRWAASLGIVSGYGNGSFGSDDTCTRSQIVTMLYRYAVATGADVSVGADTNILSYTDALELPEYAFEAFQWACGAGIIQGANGKLMPNGTCTRGQIMTMLYRANG